MLKKQIRDLADAAYLVRLNDEDSSFVIAIKQLNVAFAAKGILGGPGVAAPFEIACETIRKRCRMAAEELIRACESSGVRSRPGLAADLKAAWVDMTLARGFPKVQKWAVDSAIPHAAGSMDRIEMNWQTVQVLGTTDGKAEADNMFDHFAAQLARDHSQAVRERVIALGSAAVGAVASHVTDIAKWVGGLFGHP